MDMCPLDKESSSSREESCRRNHSSSTTMQQHFVVLFLILTTLPSLSHSEKCNPQDKNGLLNIKKQFGNSNKLSSWLPTTDCCTHNSHKWVGVSCDGSYRVIGIDLSHLDLPHPVPIPPSIFTTLPFLSFLYLTHTPNLVGPIPPSIVNLTKLRNLYFSHTNISGEIPSTLAEIKTLSGIALTDNKLTGHLPTTLSSLPKLKGIGFDGNQLTGEIPESYGSFSTDLFKVLTLSRNRLSGKIPASLAKLNLEMLNVSNNNLCGQIPQGGKLQRFDESCYAHNKCLCGSPLKACKTSNESHKYEVY
jgi:hypothetical protein